MGGVCGGPALTEEERRELEYEKKMTAMIESAMQKEQNKEDQVLKLLLLGTGESGKSTLFKQIVHLYGSSKFDTQTRMPYASIVYTNLIVGCRTLIQWSDKLSTKFPDCKISDAVLGSKTFLLNEVKMDQEVNSVVAQHMKAVWEDPGLKRTFDNRAYFQLTDSVRYFLDNVERIGEANYVPSYQDVLHCRARTTGIVETSFRIQTNMFKMVDVGGQRNERKKWIHCFENVTAVIFVAAINEYDQVLYEDGVTNRVIEALDLFGDICNSRWFRNTNMILFLNKKDLFYEKLIDHKIDLTVSEHFSDYTGGLVYENATAYLQELFLQRNEYAEVKQVYVHITCATDTDNVSFTFSAVKDIIIKNRLKECGLLE